MLMPNQFQPFSQSFDLLIEEIKLVLVVLFDWHQRVCRNNFRLQVRQRTHTKVGRIRVNFLVHNEGDEKPQLGDLAGNGLNVYTVDTVFNQVKLASKIKLVELGIE